MKPGLIRGQTYLKLILKGGERDGADKNKWGSFFLASNVKMEKELISYLDI
jgi:hypothetical protein